MRRLTRRASPTSGPAPAAEPGRTCSIPDARRSPPMAVPDPTPDIRSPSRWLPDGHELPELYAYQRGGIWQVTPRVDRKGEQLPPSLARVTFGPLAIATILNSSEGEQWFDLLWYDGEQAVTRRVDGAALRSGRVLVRELGCFGIPF